MSRREHRIALVVGGLLGLLLALVGCTTTTYRVAGHANDYDYLFHRGELVCGTALGTVQSEPCYAAARALIGYRATLDLADAAVQRKGPLALTEAQLAADRKAALKAVEALGVIP